MLMSVKDFAEGIGVKVADIYWLIKRKLIREKYCDGGSNHRMLYSEDQRKASRLLNKRRRYVTTR